MFLLVESWIVDNATTWAIVNGISVAILVAITDTGCKVASTEYRTVLVDVC